MNCMKCGREVALGQVFCKECLADMATYPIRPDTPVNLPPQTSIAPSRRTKPAKKPRKPEEQVAILQRILVILVLLVMLLSLACAMAGYALLRQYHHPAETTPPGQNYSTEDTSGE